jgi:hypothetical protein
VSQCRSFRCHASSHLTEPGRGAAPTPRRWIPRAHWRQAVPISVKRYEGAGHTCAAGSR